MSGELTNSDFRVIFDNYEKEKKEKEKIVLEKEEKKLKRKQKYLLKKKKGDEKEEQKYRDRAEERRKGIIKDIEDASVLYNNEKNTIDESKFMGGDVEHTHLVKGLDFLLLNKVRNKLIDKINSEKEKSKGNKSVEKYNNIKTFNHEESKQIFKHFFLYEHPHNIHFKKKIEDLHNNIMNNMKFKHFNKNIHSINYKFNISPEIEQNDIPIKYIYDIDDIKICHTYYLKDTILNELDTCFKWHMENRKKKKSKRLPKRPLTTVFFNNKQIKYEDDEDIDIFKNDDTEIKKDEVISENSNDDDSDSEMSEIDNGSNIVTSNASQNNKNKANFEDNTNFFMPPNIIKKMNNNATNKNNNSLTGNIFSDTYDECYPRY
ncbi:RED-like protein, putative [Plasmodium vinckei lentum]|uniref:RED-like protein, putative n=1 Tax=Plasmodium vinckei lentum TaxID=138297 RepID=A0A6V7SX00_PLAVN|nr:RED-like protein, putative [Plasmodium vinckei lentum]